MEKKYGRAGYAMVDYIMRRMRLARWITKATNTRQEYVVLIPFSTATMNTLRSSFSACFHFCEVLNDCWVIPPSVEVYLLYERKLS